MPMTKDNDRETAQDLRRGAAIAAARGMRQLAEILSQRAGEIEAGLRDGGNYRAA